MLNALQKIPLFSYDELVRSSHRFIFDISGTEWVNLFFAVFNFGFSLYLRDIVRLPKTTVTARFYYDIIFVFYPIMEPPALSSFSYAYTASLNLTNLFDTSCSQLSSATLDSNGLNFTNMRTLPQTSTLLMAFLLLMASSYRADLQRNWLCTDRFRSINHFPTWNI